MILKIATLVLIALYVWVVEPAYPEQGDDFRAFYHLRCLSNRLLELLYVTTLSITSHFHTKIYLTSIPLKLETTDPRFLHQRIRRTKRVAVALIAGMYGVLATTVIADVL